VILNESLSFGVLGATGKGLMEMHGVNAGEVEIVALSMAHSLASVGGLCIGTTQVIFGIRIARGNIALCLWFRRLPWLAHAGCCLHV